MQKQKKNKNSKSKSKKKQLQNRWTQKDFQELYPFTPEILTSATFFVVGLHYHGDLIKVKLPSQIQTKHLPYIFHRQIYKYLLNMHITNPLRRTAQVVGFQSIDSDLLLDYQITIGKGVLSKKTSFNCLQYTNQNKLKKYKIYKCLAIGGFSKVYLTRSLRDGNFYAMKVIFKKMITENQKESIIENQKQICKSLNHPFIVKLNHCFQTHNFVCYVFDYCPGGQLFYYLKQVKRLSEVDARFYFIEILYGLMYLHQQKIIYRDLKPQNLLINHDGHVKIADFGLSKLGVTQRGLTYSFCGSTQYMPPQMILKQGHSYGVDFYTLGALLYELVTGLPPFYSRDEEQIKNSIIHEELTFPSHIKLSNQIINLLTGLLQKDPKLRLGSFKGLKQVLFHPWIGRLKSEVVLDKKLVPPYFPPINQFNFDENQLGEDQALFTQALLKQHLITPCKQKLLYANFQFTNEYHLKPEIQKIFDNYPDEKKDDVLKLVHSSSAKSLKSSLRNNSISYDNTFKRQNSSPYLPNSQINRINSTIPSSIFRNKSVNIGRNHLSVKNTSKKKLQSTYYYLSKKQNNLIPRKESSIQQSNPFLKKKKFLYNAIKNI